MKSGKQISRKEFLQWSLLAGAGCFIPRRMSQEAPIAVGVCADVENGAIALRAGCDFLEEGVGKMLMPAKADDEFEKQLDMINGIETPPIRSFIYFLPGEMKAVGADAVHDAIVQYASVAFSRAAKAGAKFVVFGSGKSREIPDGFSQEGAMDQFVKLCGRLAVAAEKSGVILGIEQLNRSETNFLNTLSETGKVVRTVAHPNLRMVCDLYHALKEGDQPALVEQFGQYIVHCHIAEKQERTPPGTKGDDFRPYFRALKKIRYTGGISLECRWNNLEKELANAVTTVRSQYDEA